MTWVPTVSGKIVDLVDPDPQTIDFKDIVIHLSNANRFAGASYINISVAQHSLIVAGIVPREVKPWALLHDAHEAYMGDIIAPVPRALGEIAARRARRQGHENVSLIRKIIPAYIDELKHGLDKAIYQAAGLPLPDDRQREIIRQADLIALRTECRDFLTKCGKSWGRRIEAVKPLTRKIKWQHPLDVADDLFNQIQAHCPALKQSGEY